MELFANILWIILILTLGFCGVFAPMLMPLFVKPEFKEKFPRYVDAFQPPYVYQSRWFKRTGVVLQRLTLTVWIPALIYSAYYILTGQLKT